MICVGRSVGRAQKMRRRNYVRGPNACMPKVRFGRLKPTYDTRVIHFDYTLGCFSMDEKETFT